ncbi:hypothetical protein Ddye_015188 [Dipteronia dyeriana]|uniref:CCHC-type domain-containing protein n=1 Tax=Dipteronia dyeriana TaxID=168575 RepID=A0AAD9WXN1_9ROSI|nr:hypothetical protein Ddye_015188 [Dipteronia dyeriana]
MSMILVGKVLSTKPINRDAFIRVMSIIWKLKKGVDIEPVTSNMFIFYFRDNEDRQKIIVGEPWSFDNALVALEIPVGKGKIENLSFQYGDLWVQIHQFPLLCMTKDIGRFLGGMIGEVIDVDGGEAGVCAGKFLRVWVKVELDKPLRRCLRVDILGDGDVTIMPFKYERLPNHCFRCGLVSHRTNECISGEVIPRINGVEKIPFGFWMRASGPPRKMNYCGNLGLRNEMTIWNTGEDLEKMYPKGRISAMSNGKRMMTSDGDNEESGKMISYVEANTNSGVVTVPEVPKPMNEEPIIMMADNSEVSSIKGAANDESRDS